MNNTIKSARIEKKLTQEDTAKALNITLRHYISIEQEKAEPKARLAVRLCKLLSLNIYKVYG